MSERTHPGEGLVRKARLARGMSLRDLADLAHVTYSTMHANERAPRPTTGQLHTYARLLHYELHVIFRDPKTGEILE